ncbi:MAG: ParA family protein [Sphingobium sp.]
MATIAIFNSKGGVGKTTVAVNLAWEAARAGYRTLLWEIDEQGDSSWILGNDRPLPRPNMAALMNDLRHVRQYVRPSQLPGLSVIAGDTDLRRTDNFFVQFARQQRLNRMVEGMKEEYDVIILDCAPGFSDANRKILLMVDLIVVPIIPSALSLRGMLRIRDFLTQNRGHHPPMLPVFSMVDRRRKTHNSALSAHPEWPVIPMASEIEQMTEQKAPVEKIAPDGVGARVFHLLWLGVERKLRSMLVIKTMRLAAE